MNEVIVVNTNVNKKRIEYLDIAKGIAILCMIIGHTIENKYMLNFIFSFHMPLFFIISGYFFKAKQETKDVVKKGIKKLITPYIITSVVIIILKTVFALIKKENAIKVMCDWGIAALFGSGSLQGINIFTGEKIIPIGAIWFLLSLFFAQIILNYILKLKKTTYQIVSLFIISLVRLYFT